MLLGGNCFSGQVASEWPTAVIGAVIEEIVLNKFIGSDCPKCINHFCRYYTQILVVEAFKTGLYFAIK